MACGKAWLLAGVAAAGLAGAARAQDAPEPLRINRPKVTDTAHLSAPDGSSVTLFGIEGEGGDLAHSLQSFITDNGDRVACEPHDGGSYTCRLPTGVDVAATALANGAARTAGDAPADYQEQEQAAQSARLGVWAALPPAPVPVAHPVVQTTAVITGGRESFPLDGLIGFDAAFYTLQLQNYITAHGDRLTCQQRESGGFVCLLPDGTDIAAVALQTGIARAAPDAPAAYRAAQAKAVASRSGIWFEPPQQDLAQLLPPPSAPACCTAVPGEAGAGLAYENGLPTAVIDGEPVFFVFAGVLGFGFFDHLHRWHSAPATIAARLERFHPDGAGLRLPHTVVAGGPAPFAPPGFHQPGLNRPANPAVFRGPGFSGPAARPAPPLQPSAPLPGVALNRPLPPVAYPMQQRFGFYRPPSGVGPSLARLRPAAPLPAPRPLLAPRPGFIGRR